MREPRNELSCSIVTTVIPQNPIIAARPVKVPRHRQKVVITEVMDLTTEVMDLAAEVMDLTTDLEEER